MHSGKAVKITLTGQAKEAHEDILRRSDKKSRQILKSFERLIEVLRQNPQYGDPIRKELIPKKYKEQGITRLYRAGLSNYWRVLYTLTGNEIEILVLILSITDHAEYNKIFSYRKK